MRFNEIFLKSINDCKKNWGMVLAMSGILMIFKIITFFIAFLMPEFITSILDFILTACITAGLFSCALTAVRGEKPEFGDLTVGFGEKAGRVMFRHLLEGLFIFLWGLLLIIPGIIKGIGYSQSLFILLENPDLTASQCLKESESLIDGCKTDYFVMDIIWGLISLGIIVPVYLLLLSLGGSDLYGILEITLTLAQLLIYPLYILFRANFYLFLVNGSLENVIEKEGMILD